MLSTFFAYKNEDCSYCATCPFYGRSYDTYLYVSIISRQSVEWEIRHSQNSHKQKRRMSYARIPSPNRSGLSSSLGAFCLLGVSKHLPEDLQAGLSLTGGECDSNDPLRVVCVNGDLWQSHVADLFAGKQHKGGAARDAQAFPALLRFLEGLV